MGKGGSDQGTAPSRDTAAQWGGRPSAEESPPHGLTRWSSASGIGFWPPYYSAPRCSSAILQRSPAAPSQGPPVARAILSLDRNRPPCPSRSVPVRRSVRWALWTESPLGPSRRAPTRPISSRRRFRSRTSRGFRPRACRASCGRRTSCPPSQGRYGTMYDRGHGDEQYARRVRPLGVDVGLLRQMSG